MSLPNKVTSVSLAIRLSAHTSCRRETELAPVFSKTRFHRSVCVTSTKHHFVQSLVSSISYSPIQSPLALWQKIQSQFSRNLNSASFLFFLKHHLIIQQEYWGNWSLLFSVWLFFVCGHISLLLWQRIPNYTKCCFIIVSDAGLKWSLGGYISLYMSI